MDFIPIRAYDNYIAANLEMALLQDAGINCYIKDEYTVTIDPLLSPALGGMKLMVEDSYLPAALYLLEKSDKLFLQTVACPHCRQFSLERVHEEIHYDRLIDKIKSLIINGQEKKVQKYYRCLSCGHKFAELPE